MQDNKNQVDSQPDEGKGGAEDDTIQAMVTALLFRAGIAQPVQTIQAITDQGITNEIYLLRLHTGHRFIVRRYQWPWAEQDHDRARKEQHVHRLLVSAGVCEAAGYGGEGQSAPTLIIPTLLTEPDPR